MCKTVARSVGTETGDEHTPCVASSLIGGLWFNETSDDRDPEVQEPVSRANTDRESRSNGRRGASGLLYFRQQELRTLQAVSPAGFDPTAAVP